MVLARTYSTKTVSTPRTISAAIPNLLVADERCRALDLHHLDACTLLVHVVLVVRARAPLLAPYLHPASVGVDALEDDRPGADESRRPGAKGRRRVQVAARDRPDEEQRADRAEDEHRKLHRHTGAQSGDQRRWQGGQRHRAEEEAERRE